MLLAKSCHDIDWLRYIVGRRCVQVSSFGSLMHFRKEKKPTEAGGGEQLVSLDGLGEGCTRKAVVFLKYSLTPWGWR